MKSVCITTLVFLVFLVHSNCGLLASTTTLLFAGDVMGNKPQVNAAFDPVTQQYDYKPCFQYMKPIIEDATIAIVNLEVTLPGEPPYTGFPRFRTPDALVDGLKFAGFDVLVTANNHSNDSGHQGVSHTIDAIKQRNLLQTGTFASQADRDLYCPLVFWVNDFKLALLNYTFHTNGLSTEAPGIVNRIDANAIKNDIAAAQLQNADLIIVFFHWGTECVNYENAYQQQWAQTAANLGADLIIGAHPHVVQPIKTVKTTRADGTEAIVPVVYSLGNFISNAISTNTSIGQIVKVNLMRHPTTCQAYFDQLLYLPVWRYPEDGQLGGHYKRTYYTLPASVFATDALNLLQMPQAHQQQLLNALTHARQVMQNSSYGAEQFVLMNSLLTNPAYETAYCQYLNSAKTTNRAAVAQAAKNDNAPLAQKAVKSKDSSKNDNNKTAKKNTNVLALQPNTNPKYAPKTVIAKMITTTYKVQFLASIRKDLKNYPFKNVTIDKNDQGLYRYVTGYFTNRTQADAYVEEVKKMGFQGFVVTYNNGKRVN